MAYFVKRLLFLPLKNVVFLNTFGDMEFFLLLEVYLEAFDISQSHIFTHYFNTISILGTKFLKIIYNNNFCPL